MHYGNDTLFVTIIKEDSTVFRFGVLLKNSEHIFISDHKYYISKSPVVINGRPSRGNRTLIATGSVIHEVLDPTALTTFIFTGYLQIDTKFEFPPTRKMFDHTNKMRMPANLPLLGFDDLSYDGIRKTSNSCCTAPFTVMWKLNFNKNYTVREFDGWEEEMMSYLNR